MHNCKKRVVQCLNVSFITVAQFLTDVRHVLQPKFGIQNDNLNGTDFRLPVLVRESLLFPVVEVNTCRRLFTYKKCLIPDYRFHYRFQPFRFKDTSRDEIVFADGTRLSKSSSVE